jgi:signal transduction histidine kinase
MIIDSADAIYQGMHQMITRMRPLVLDRINLVDALQDLVQESRNAHPSLHIELHSDELPDDLAHDIVTAIYRICQEAITNALRHANASNIWLRITCRDNVIEMIIDNDGASLATDWQGSGHFGVIGMQERAHCLGGQFTLLARQPCGARVHARLPLVSSVAQEDVSNDH